MTYFPGTPERSVLFLLLPFWPWIRGDGLEQHNMVGFLSEQRVLIVDVGDASRATLLDVACQIDHARKHRTWRVPQPYEASICVYINIVPLLGQIWELPDWNDRMGLRNHQHIEFWWMWIERSHHPSTTIYESNEKLLKFLGGAMKKWNLVLKDFFEDSITKMWTMSCWTLTASHYFRLFFLYIIWTQYT